ncbi:hypothetical protein ABLN87_13910 [Ruegeria sp. SCPT10]|uniref:hypothetical protein n=1 Tax=Ruegeria sp. SCP10 TaxID=3141377 RepID=UPI00333C1706
MTHPRLIPLRFENGLWQGHLEAETKPDVEVHYLGEPLPELTLTEAQDGWALAVPVPTAALSEGVHCFVIVDVATTQKLGNFTVIAGEPAADDLRAEVELLRAELEMLKRAFRQICRGDD